MKECSHAEQTAGGFCCTLLRELTGANLHPPPSSPSSPCTRCRPQWIDDKPPTKESLTPILRSFVTVARRDNAGLVTRPPVSWAQAALDAAKALATFIKSGGELVDAKVKAERAAICEACPDKITIPIAGDFCKRCRCCIPIKIQMPSQACPVGKWNSRTAVDLAICPGCPKTAQPQPAIKYAKGETLEQVIPIPAKRSSPPTRWIVGVTSAPRQVSTLAQSLRSIVLAGWGNPIVFAEPGTQLPDPEEELLGGVRYVQRAKKHGAWKNFYRSMCDLLEADPTADAVLLFQDDVLIVPGTRAYLEAALWPSGRVGCVSLYTNKFYAQKAGWRKFPGRWTWGALAFALPRDRAKEFVESKTAKNWPKSRNIDVAMGDWLLAANYDIYHSNPSLIEHTGHTSSIWKSKTATGGRLAHTFAAKLVTKPIEVLVNKDWRERVPAIAAEQPIEPLGFDHQILIRSAYPENYSIEQNRDRLRFTEALCVRSLLSQSEKRFRLVVWINPTDPLLSERKAIFSKLDCEFRTELLGDAGYQTRMDDDDALAFDFVDRVQRSIEDNPRNEWRSLPPGVRVNDGHWSYARKVNNQFITRRCAPGQSVFDLNHTKIPDPLIIDDDYSGIREVFWMWYRHAHQLSNELGLAPRRREKHPVAMLEKFFDVDFDLLRGK